MTAEKTPGQVSWTARNMALAGPGDQPGDVLAELDGAWDYLSPEEREAEEAGAKAVLDGLRKALHAIELGIAEPSPQSVARDALNGRYFDPDTDAGVWNFNAAARPASEQEPGLGN